MSMADVARRMNQDLASKSSMKIGRVIRHPDGRKVKVVSGEFLDKTYGRVSNWWTWKEVLADGKFGPNESGYGW